MEMAAIYGLSIVFYFLFVLQEAEQVDMKKLMGIPTIN